jgi:glutamyl-tRNA synthetase
MAGFFFTSKQKYQLESLLISGRSISETLVFAKQVQEVLTSMLEIKVETAEAPMRALLKKMDLTPQQGFGFLREAISAQRVSPPLFESMEIIGKNEVIKRLNNAMMFLQNCQ